MTLLTEPPILVKNKDDGSIFCYFKARYIRIPVSPGYAGEPGYKLEAYLTCQNVRLQYFCIYDSSGVIYYDKKFGTFSGDDSTSGNIDGDHVTFVSDDDNDTNELLGTVTLAPPNACGATRLQIQNVKYHNVELVLKEKRTHVAVDQRQERVVFQDVEVVSFSK